MRYISGWVESSVLRQKAKDFLRWEDIVQILKKLNNNENSGFTDKDYHNLLDTFLYYSNIDIVNFLTKYDTSVKNIKFDASLLAKEFIVF